MEVLCKLRNHVHLYDWYSSHFAREIGDVYNLRNSSGNCNLYGNFFTVQQKGTWEKNVYKDVMHLLVRRNDNYGRGGL